MMWWCDREFGNCGGDPSQTHVLLLWPRVKEKVSYAPMTGQKTAASVTQEKKESIHSRNYDRWPQSSLTFGIKMAAWK